MRDHLSSLVTHSNRADIELSTLMSELYADPLTHVMVSYPWDREPSIQVVKLPSHYQDQFRCVYGPDMWQCEFLEDLGREIRKRGFNGHDAVDPVRFSTVTGHGTGKSTLSAWLIKFIMDTRPYSKGSVTANTDEQLRTKTWAELGKWHQMSLTSHWFSYSNTRGNMALHHVSKAFQNQWRCDAKTCKKEKSEAFAGQHAPSATSFYIFDEASSIPPELFEVREGGMASGEPMVFDFGNGTRTTGRFRENCQGKHSHRYITRSIDSRTCTLPNKAKIEQDRKDWGEESDFFKTRWRGMFPDQGDMQFIAFEAVEDACNRPAPISPHPNPPLVLGVDVARFGMDSSVIYPRLGDDCRSFPPRIYRSLDTTQLTERVLEAIVEFTRLGKTPSLIAVDGTGVGGGVVDQLRRANVDVLDVQMGAKATKEKQYRCKADECWGNLRTSLPRLLLPSRDTEIGTALYEQLTQRQFGHTSKGQIALEPKKMMRDRGVGSPDEADALALTFVRDTIAIPETGPLREFYSATRRNVQNIHDYDPLDIDPYTLENNQIRERLR